MSDDADVTGNAGSPDAAELASLAEYIRVPVQMFWHCINGIGRELLAAKGVLAPGDWQPWLEREFGWTERTAHDYIAFAEALKAGDRAALETLTIDLSALRTLSAALVRREAAELEQAARAEAEAQAEAEREQPAT